MELCSLLQKLYLILHMIFLIKALKSLNQSEIYNRLDDISNYQFKKVYYKHKTDAIFNLNKYYEYISNKKINLIPDHGLRLINKKASLDFLNRNLNQNQTNKTNGLNNNTKRKEDRGRYQENIFNSTSNRRDIISNYKNNTKNRHKKDTPQNQRYNENKNSTNSSSRARHRNNNQNKNFNSTSHNDSSRNNKNNGNKKNNRSRNRNISNNSQNNNTRRNKSTNQNRNNSSVNHFDEQAKKNQANHKKDSLEIKSSDINATQSEIEKDLNEYRNRQEFQEVLRLIITTNFNTNHHKCLAVICDNYYLDVFQRKILSDIGKNLSFYMIAVSDYEDLISPNYKILKSLQQVNKEACKAYVIFLANGFQVTRLLKFSDRHRIIDTRANFIILYDTRLFQKDLYYLWRRIVNVVFVRRYKYKTSTVKQTKGTSWFELSTVPFPSPIRGILIPKRLDVWKYGKLNSNESLFPDKTEDLKDQPLRVVVFQHIPAVIKVTAKTNINNSNSENTNTQVKNSTIVYSGVEVEALQTLGKAMHFKPVLYEIEKATEQQWGRKQPDGSYDGLLGEIISGKADIGLGDLYYTPYHLNLIDLTIPYNTECLTFLTPEALTDNSWQTLILPFKLYMWIGVLIGLFVGGFIFYGLSRFQYFITAKNNNESKEIMPWKPQIKITKHFDIPRSYYPVKQNYTPELKVEGLYLFGDLVNSFLYTYSMLLVVSLPKLPSGWSLRILTGWYWLYCILIVVSYRASMTAILANPAPRVTIDTLQELAESNIRCGGWGDQILDFFQTSLDPAGQKVGEKFENVDDPDKAVERVAKGEFAYYENQYFLKAISVKRQVMLQMKKSNNTDLNNDLIEETNTSAVAVKNERNLHIMSNCVIQMPISIGLQKNSPLKPRANKFLRRVIEAGLIEKWLNDVMLSTLNNEVSQDEKIKALMNLKKMYGALVILGVGYGLSLILLISELIHWHCIVKRKSTYDKYSVKKYYNQSNKNQELITKK